MSKRSTQSALIEKRIQETEDTATLRLDVPSPFEWQPGQFIMVHAEIDGESVRRAYSVSSSPTRNYMEITIRQTEDPTMSKYLNEIQEGEYLEVRGPYGRFIWNEDVSKRAFFLGAGSGITPFRAMLEYMSDKGLDNPVKLLYTCGHGDNVIFKDELEELSAELPTVYYELSLTREPEDKYPETRKGRIDNEHLKNHIKGYENANFYMCGTPGFVKSMMTMLKDLGIERDQLKREQWG